MVWDPGFEAAFNPRAVAVVGVSRSERQEHPGFTGLRLFRILREHGFAGRIYPVNPKIGEIEGAQVYPSVTAVPEPLDLVIVAVPAASVPEVLEDCVTAKALNVHICTSGFAETGQEEGKRLESRMREIALRGGLRVIGPNCMGLQVPSVHMGTFGDVPLVQGPVAFISQSGGHVHWYLEAGSALGFGFSKMISYGNALTMDATDFLEYLATDPETQIVCMYLEGIKDGRRLVQLVRKLNLIKPVIVWKGGLTSLGARAASSHTGSLAGSKEVWDTFFKQTGAISVDSIEEMAEVTMALLHLKPSPERRVALMGSGGGSNVANGDICAKEGLDAPALTLETRAKLMEFVSLVNQSVMNPMDIFSIFGDAFLLRRVIELVAADPVVDIIILYVNVGAFEPAATTALGRIKKSILDLAPENLKGKPVVVAMRDQAKVEAAEGFAQGLREGGIPVYDSLRGACCALSRFASYHEFVAESRT
jgi:acyl-CoA synthetase (NDP forming)